MNDPNNPNKLNTYAFIDSQNLNLGTQKLGWKMDWRKFRQYLRDKYNVTSAFLFIGYMAENQTMYEQLHDAGYLIVLKPTLEIKEKNTPEDKTEAGQTGAVRKTLVKGNIDAELVLYAMKEQPNYDKAIIVSGDGDFYCLAEYLEEKQKLLHVMTPNWQYSSLLKPYEKYIVRIDKLRNQLAYHDRKKK